MLSVELHFGFINCLNYLFWGIFSFLSCLLNCLLVFCSFAGCSPGGWSWREVASVPRGDTFNIQAYPHASGWWTMSIGSLTHSDILEEPSQHGAKEQEENIYAFAEWVSWICACPNGRRPVCGSIFGHGFCMYWNCSALKKKNYSLWSLNSLSTVL